MNMPRPEHPRPLLYRKEWINLNGEWDFEIDNACVGKAKNFPARTSLDGKILVPFCPESRLSGVAHTDFINCVWYRRSIEIPSEWAGKRVLLHFGAVDYRATVYVNGKTVGEHRGGYTPFSFDITDYLREENNYVTLCAVDDLRSGHQAVGKQSRWLRSFGCAYSRTTGIWQTVFLEAVDRYHIQNIRVVTDIEKGSAELTVKLSNYAVGCRLSVRAFFEGRLMGSEQTVVNAMNATLHLPLSEKHLWQVGKGGLYDLELILEKEGRRLDEVRSYFGLRSVALTERKFLVNGKSVFGRWVLDQGYYPDGLYTAPTEEDLKKDILYSMELGFNGARLHEKMFEPLFLYWADKLGYMVWGEHASWGLNTFDIGEIGGWLPEWMEFVERDFSHPSVIGWCPFNETWDIDGKRQSDDLIKLTWQVTKAMDPTRPVIDTSGHYHVGAYTDIYDIHDYEQDVAVFAASNGKGVREKYTDRQKWYGQPFFISEYGGMGWSMEQGGWGYGDAPKSEEEFVARYKGLTDVMLDNPDCFGFCYTQLYDIEQEQNGLLTYDRRFKFDPALFYAINSRKAAIEEET